MNQTPLLLTPITLLLLLLLILSPQTHSQTPHISPTQPPKPSPTSPSPKPSPSSPSPSPKPSSSPSSTTLDPKQLKALESLDIPTKKDPCSNSETIRCDNSKPFRNLLSLTLSKCSSDVSLSTTVLENLSTLQDLTFQNCSSVSPVAFPPALASNLRSFTCVDSFKKISGVWLSRFENVTDLTVTDVPIKASGPVIIVAHLKKLSKITLSRANLTGELPGKSWGSNVSHIDLSENLIKGKIPDSMTSLDKLTSLDLSSNQLTGVLPDSIGDLAELKNLSLSKNSLSGPIPESISELKSLNTLDLSSNQFNGSIPKFLSNLKGLKHLNLEKNNFQGVMPFNESFIKKLEVFKINNNDNLCYNHSTISSKLKLGIAKCDKNGFPISAPAMSPSDDDYVEDDRSDDSTAEKSGGHKGPNKVVLGVAIALSSIVFLIIFLILLSRKCA